MKIIGFVEEKKPAADTRISLHFMEASAAGPSASHTGACSAKATDWR